VKIDSNALCDDCKDWVEKARKIIEDQGMTDQIISSLELSCELCPNQDGRSKCKKLIEDNIHEIQKLLISAMNPDAICSAMHLCNNAAFTEMFANKRVDLPKQQLLPFTCGQCSVIGSYFEKKFKSLSRDEVLERTLKMCGETSSFSDSCMNIALRNSDDIYLHLLKEITRTNLCQSSCAGHNQFSEGIVGIEPAFSESDIPCELCEQLMLHLREVLIANTTEIEFKNVLEGFCAQIPKITDECISITNQYYDQIYQFLAKGLDANKTCSLIGICASGSYNVPSMPLLSTDIFAEQTVKNINVEISSENSLQLVNGGKLCAACEYAMHFIHIEIGKNTAQEKIAEYARKSCKTLPLKYVKQCENVMDMFGDEIAMAIYQGTEPRLVCSGTKLCPTNLDVDYLERNAVDEKPTCPFCLFAMQEVRDVIQSNSTKENVEKVVSQLCNHLTDKLKSQCVEFVKQYSAEVVDMVLANFTPQEACVFIRLCSNEKPKLKFGLIDVSSENVDSEGEGLIFKLL
jgi:saposin